MLVMEHPRPEKLFEVAKGSVELETREIEHLWECADCRDWLRIFTRHEVDCLRKSHQKRQITSAA